MNDEKNINTTPVVGGEIQAWQCRSVKNGEPWSSWRMANDDPTPENMKFDGVFSYEYRPLYAAPPASPLRRISPKALAALNHYRQADEDGVMVIVSRQALDEAIAIVSASPSEQPASEDK